jgi:hypothetical protein
MRRIAGVLLAIGCLASVWLGMLHLLPRPLAANWIEKLYTQKEAIARRVGGPKIVLIGGSSVHFGISAKQLSEALGRPVVNLGSHAGLGADYILYRARRSLEPGDIAMLALEPDLLRRAWPVDDVLADYVDLVDTRYLASAPAVHAAHLLFGVSPVAAFRLVMGRNYVPGRLYRGDTLDEDGDETANKPEAIDPFMRENLMKSPFLNPQPLTDADRLYVLRDFVKWARSRQIKVLIGWSPFLERSAYSEPQYRRLFAETAKVYSSTGAVVVGTARDYMLPAEAMADTGFHPTTEGARQVTKTLAANLRPLIAGSALKLAAVTRMDLPQRTQRSPR